MNKETLGGVGGIMISALGTGIQTNELLQTISLCLTIIGTVITIVMALLNWWNRSKKDGKIDKEEAKEGLDIVMGGVEQIQEALDKDKEHKEE